MSPAIRDARALLRAGPDLHGSGGPLELAFPSKSPGGRRRPDPVVQPRCRSPGRRAARRRRRSWPHCRPTCAGLRSARASDPPSGSSLISTAAAPSRPTCPPGSQATGRPAFTSALSCRSADTKWPFACATARTAGSIGSGAPHPDRPADHRVIDFRGDAGGFVFHSRRSAHALIEWKNHYSVGVEAVDHEHRELIELINHLHERLLAGTEEPAVTAFLGEIFRAIGAFRARGALHARTSLRSVRRAQAGA